MKYIFKLLTGSLSLLLLLSSCDSFLDVTPKDKYTQEQLLSTKGGFYTALNGIYSKCGSTALYGENLSYKFIDVLGKRYAPIANNATITAINSYSYGDQNVMSILKNIWATGYNTILNCNVLLEQLETQQGILSVQEVQRMKGELLALRAYLHLDILRLYGPVYKRKASALSIPYNDVSTIQNLPLLTADTVLNHKIIPDLELAEALLKNSDPTIEHGVMGPQDSEDVNLGYRQLRFNYYAVIALKARAHLYGDNKEKALIEANKLLNDPAVNTIFPFVDPNKLLANNINPDRVFSSESFFGVFNSNRANIYTNTFSAENMGSNVLQPKADFISTLFGDEIQDYRYRTHWVTSTTAGINGDIFIKYKGIKDDKKELFYGTFMPLIRLSEIYYIAAECETTLNNKIMRLNEIRAQRGLSEKQVKDETAFMTALRNEYLKEFVGEGQIFFLYKRLYVNIVKAENGFDGSTIAASEARFVAPLPQSELENR